MVVNLHSYREVQEVHTEAHEMKKGMWRLGRNLCLFSFLEWIKNLKDSERGDKDGQRHKKLLNVE